MDEILATADKEMNLGRQELENIDQFEKTLAVAREENEKKIEETRAKLAQIEGQAGRGKQSQGRARKESKSRARHQSERSDDEDEETMEEEEAPVHRQGLSQVSHRSRHHAHKAGHHKKRHGSVYHEPQVRSWHITSIGENESVSDAMNRQEELDKAQQQIQQEKDRKEAILRK